MIGGGCTFLKLAQKVDDIKATLENDEQRVRASCPCCCFLVMLAVESVDRSMTPWQTFDPLLHHDNPADTHQQILGWPCMHEVCSTAA